MLEHPHKRRIRVDSEKGLKLGIWGAREMARWLELAALPEDLSLIPNTHMAAHTYL